MNSQQVSLAERCMASAYDGTMTFPSIVGALYDGGFEGYMVDYRRHTITYYLPDGESVVLQTPSCEDGIAATFDSAGVGAAVKEAQTGAPGYSYAGFNAKVRRAGCAGYMVSFTGRRVVYFGRTAETHVEHFPS